MSVCGLNGVLSSACRAVGEGVDPLVMSGAQRGRWLGVVAVGGAQGIMCAANLL